jgi:hypothetical protein
MERLLPNTVLLHEFEQIIQLTNLGIFCYGGLTHVCGLVDPISQNLRKNKSS